MKKLFTLAIVILISAICFGQTIMPIDSNTYRITYQQVVELPNLKSEELYLKAKEWFSNAFVRGKSVIDLDDDKGFKIIGKGTVNITFKNELGNIGDGGNVSFKISLFFKDNRYKYIITDFIHEQSPGMTSRRAIGGPLESEKPACGRYLLPMKYWERVHEDTQSQIEQLILSLNKFLKGQNSSEGW